MKWKKAAHTFARGVEGRAVIVSAPFFIKGQRERNRIGEEGLANPWRKEKRKRFPFSLFPLALLSEELRHSGEADLWCQNKEVIWILLRRYAMVDLLYSV